MERTWRAEQDRREKDMERKMEELLEKSNRSARKATGLRCDDLSMDPDFDLPEGFKILIFEMFNGAENPKAHLHSYCDKLVGVKRNEPLIMRLFSHRLTGEAAEWFATQDMRQWLHWEDLAESLMERFHLNIETALDRYYLEKVKQKSTETYRELANRWRAKAARVQPPMCEGELVSIFIRSQEPNFYNRMFSMDGRAFSVLVKIVVVLVAESGIGSIEASKSIACPSCTHKRLKVYCVLCGIIFVLLGNVFGLKGVDGYRWIKCLGCPDLWNIDAKDDFGSVKERLVGA
ncbi:uncharacterized protein LOC132630664 [Lycium barbarum]|uniref:uncharacterized protein LOC132630664 n=1 Tax=Lycium barbarum TaxID=112863 RepID=UPI00293F060A|nr:uncharacterized protein LOC132630664 [Lycium barbarum]